MKDWYPVYACRINAKQDSALGYNDFDFFDKMEPPESGPDRIDIKWDSRTHFIKYVFCFFEPFRPVLAKNAKKL
jgi:hypothetical protein